MSRAEQAAKMLADSIGAEIDGLRAELAVLREENESIRELATENACYADELKARAESAEARVTALEAALKDYINLRLFVQAYDGRVFDKERILASIDRAAALTGKEDAQHG